MSLIKIPFYFLWTVISLVMVILPQINFSDFIQSTVTSKFIFFAYSCLLILGGLVVKMVVSKSIALWTSRLDIILLILVFYITLNRYLVQPNVDFSIRYMELLGLVLLYAVLRIFSIKSFLWLLLCIVVSGILQAIYGSLQLLGYYSSNHSGFNITGSFFNPGPYAGFLAIIWTLSLGMYLFRDRIFILAKSGRKKGTDMKFIIANALFHYVPLLGIATTMMVLPATRSRAAWLAVLIGSIVMLIYKYNILKIINNWGSIKKGKATIMAVILLVIGLYGLYHFKKDSADGRMLIWKVSIDIIKDNPVFGVGFDRFKAHYMDAQAEFLVIDSNSPSSMVADNTYYAFNEFLQFGVENGLLGIILAAILLFLLFKVRVTSENKVLKVLGFSVLLSVLVFGTFSYPAQILPIKLVCVSALALLAKVDVKKFSFLLKIKRNTRIGNVVGAIVAGFIMLYGYSYIQTVGTAFLNWKRALDTYNYGLYEDSVKEFEKSYPILHKEGDFLMNYGKALVMAGDYKRAVNILERAKYHLNTTVIETALGDAYKNLKMYQNAEKAYTRASNMIPSRFYPQYLLAKLYSENGEEKKAKTKAREILDKEIKVPSKAIREIRSEMERILKKSPGIQ